MSLRVVPLLPSDDAALDWVMHGMRATLVEVEGQANAEALHDLPWLRDRALSHVDGRLAPAAAWVACDDEAIVGHCLARREADDAGPLGLFATAYVLPSHRRAGVALALHAEAERWFQAQGLPRRATWTSSTNTPLVRLYERQGYRVAATFEHPQTGTRMVQLMHPAPPQPNPSEIPE